MIEDRIRIDVEKKGVFTGHRDCIYAMTPATDASQFFTSGADGLVVQWSLETPDLGKVVAQVQNTVYAICFLPDRNQLVIGQNFEGVHLVDLETQRIVKSAKISEHAIFDIQHFEGKLYIATGDGTLVVLLLEDFTTLARVKTTEKHARTIAMNPQANHVAVGYSDNHIRVFDAHSFRLLQAWEAHHNSIFTLRYTNDYRHLLSGSRDAHLKIWDAHNLYSLHEPIVAHMYTINHIAFREDGRFFATCSKDKSIKVWDTQPFKLLKVIDKARHAGHGTSVNKLFWKGKNTLVSCSDDHSISEWKLTFRFPQTDAL